MSGNKNSNREEGTIGGYKTTLTNLPGLKGVPIIVSHPRIVKENSSKPVKR
jgi:hypothetical protein